MTQTSEQFWNARKPTGQFGWIGLLTLTLVVTGCGLIKPKPAQPKAKVDTLRPETNRVVGTVSLLVLQAEGMRFADNYTLMMAQAADDFGKAVGTPEARIAALKWKLNQATSAYVDASGSHPVLNVLDLVVLATVARMVVEDYGVGQVFGEAALPLLDTHRRLETNAWLLVNGVLKPAQRQELADMIQKWRRENPHQRYVGGIRFGELASALGQSLAQTKSSPNSVFSLLFLDPLASMDPTAAALQEARYSAERAMYYGQRMPYLLNWQLELMGMQLAAQPEARQIMTNAQRFATSAELLAETSSRLPQQLTNALATEGKRMRGLLEETRQTLTAGNEMAISVNAAIKSLDEFVRFVTPTNTVSARDTNRAPFNVLDYGTAATDIAGAAKELHTLLTTVHETTPQLQELSEQTTEQADRVLTRGFRMGLVLVVVLLAGAVLAGLVYRWLVNRLTSPHRQS